MKIYTTNIAYMLDIKTPMMYNLNIPSRICEDQKY